MVDGISGPDLTPHLRRFARAAASASRLRQACATSHRGRLVARVRECGNCRPRGGTIQRLLANPEPHFARRATRYAGWRGTRGPAARTRSSLSGPMVNASTTGQGPR
jgi:hypothetical protein